jgi:GYF domain 2
MAEWFVQQASEVVGPLGPAELLALVRSGVVTQHTKIRKRDSEWLMANEVGGLFEAAMRPTIESRCPECDALLDSVPCQCPKCGRRVNTPRTRIIENTICQNHVLGDDGDETN